MFRNQTPIFMNLTGDVIFTCQTLGIKAVELTDVLAKLELTDGTLLKDAENYGIEAAYSKGYKVDLTVTDYNSYETVYEGQFDFTDAIETALNAQ